MGDGEEEGGRQNMTKEASLDRPLPFFLSGEDLCPYGTQRKERKLFAKLTGDSLVDNTINAILTLSGFRRSMDIMYRPECPDCRACVPVRLDITAFAPSRSQKRVARRNADLIVEWTAARASASLYDLFRGYLIARHEESDMTQMDWLAFRTMIEGGCVTKNLLLLRQPATKRVLGCMLSDDVGGGLSAVYSFFDPCEAQRSLGTHLILSLIAKAKELEKRWIYLGYWIEGLPKMAYKAAFQPLEPLPQKKEG